jgi:hypothetical protein
MKEFKEYFSLEDLKQIMATEDKYEALGPLHQALDKFLKENGLLKPFTNHQYRRTNFGFDWNNYITGKEEPYQKERVLGNIIDKHMFMKVFYEENVEKSYNTLNDKINKGNFHPFDLMDSLYDFETGEDLKLVLKNWEPTLMRYIPGESWTDRGRFEIATEAPVEKVVLAQIEFKTGNLIVADWFKINEFTELVDKDNDFDVNSEKGRLDQAKYYLEKFNFVHTAAWHDSDLYQKGNTFVFARYDEDFECPDGYEDKGKVNKELRALSIIEKEHLIELVGSEEKVEAYLKDNNWGVLQLKVTPGIYTYTMASGPEFIKKEIGNLNGIQTEENQQEVSKLFEDKHFHPIMIMQALELKPEKKLKMK